MISKNVEEKIKVYETPIYSIFIVLVNTRKEFIFISDGNLYGFPGEEVFGWDSIANQVIDILRSKLPLTKCVFTDVFFGEQDGHAVAYFFAENATVYYDSPATKKLKAWEVETALSGIFPRQIAEEHVPAVEHFLEKLLYVESI